jgi:cytochrome c peroxidase
VIRLQDRQRVFAAASVAWVALVLVATAQTGGFQWNKPVWAPTPLVPPDNPMTDAKVTLGRYLFYDKRLSLDGSMSCGSCHEQKRAFTDGQPMHAGVTGEMGIRSSMTLTNVAYLSSYTWANPQLTTLEKQMLVPLFSDHPLEMGLQGHDPQLIQKLHDDAAYTKMFQESFPAESGDISVVTITKSIAAFERTLLSFNSAYDRYKHGQPDAISPAAKRGEALFFGERLECYHCHGGTNFTDNNMQQGQAFPEAGFHNTGLYNEDGAGAYKKWDSGLRVVTERPEDEGKFRTPTLRNIAVTGPYMHDGSIPTLDEVIRKHYAVKGRSALSVHGASPLRDEFIEGFNINDSEVKDLVAFLNSLTDDDFLHNPAFSDPHSSHSLRGLQVSAHTSRTNDQLQQRSSP